MFVFLGRADSIQMVWEEWHISNKNIRIAFNIQNRKNSILDGRAIQTQTEPFLPTKNLQRKLPS